MGAWVATREGVKDADAAARQVYAWNPQKRCFSPRQIRLAWEILGSKGWLA